MGKGEPEEKDYYLATVIYRDGQKLGKVYGTREEAEQFAEEQRASRKLKSVEVEAIDREEQRLRPFEVSGPTTIH